MLHRFDMLPHIEETEDPASSSSDEDDSPSFETDPLFLEPESKTHVKKQKKHSTRVREQPAPTSAHKTRTSHIASGTGRRAQKKNAAAVTSAATVATGEKTASTNGLWITVANLSSKLPHMGRAEKSLHKIMGEKIIAQERAKKGSN
jgi:hypothetical protein